jgi:hypothetical protein
MFRPAAGSSPLELRQAGIPADDGRQLRRFPRGLRLDDLLVEPDDPGRGDSIPSPETTKKTPTPAEREYLDLKELKVYSGISIRKLRALLRDPANPIPSISLGRMIRVYKPAFDAWMANHHTVDLKRVLDEVRSARRKVTS